MAGFWKDSFLAKRREEWKRDVSAVQYKAGSTWYNAQITEKELTGTVLRIKFVTTDSQALTITEIRLLDRDGNVAGSSVENIAKNATQGLLYVIEVSIIDSVATT